MPMKNPPHPGEIIRDLYVEPLGLTVTQAAAGLGVSRKTLSLLLNGHAGVAASTLHTPGWTQHMWDCAPVLSELSLVVSSPQAWPNLTRCVRS